MKKKKSYFHQQLPNYSVSCLLFYIFSNIYILVYFSFIYSSLSLHLISTFFFYMLDLFSLSSFSFLFSFLFILCSIITRSAIYTTLSMIISHLGVFIKVLQQQNYKKNLRGVSFLFSFVSIVQNIPQRKFSVKKKEKKKFFNHVKFNIITISRSIFNK